MTRPAGTRLESHVCAWAERLLEGLQRPERSRVKATHLERCLLGLQGCLRHVDGCLERSPLEGTGLRVPLELLLGACGAHRETSRYHGLSQHPASSAAGLVRTSSRSKSLPAVLCNSSRPVLFKILLQLPLEGTEGSRLSPYRCSGEARYSKQAPGRCALPERDSVGGHTKKGRLRVLALPAPGCTVLVAAELQIFILCT